MSGATKAVFISYASQDAGVAARVCEALQAAGIDVRFDRSVLRGGDAWDQKIRREIRDCALFIPVISANTAARPEGYFRLEWSLAEQRSHMIARNQAFIVPVCLDRAQESAADVPESFQRVQWTHLAHGDTPSAFAARIAALLGAPVAPTAVPPVMAPAGAVTVRRARHPLLRYLAAGIVLLALASIVWYSARPHLSELGTGVTTEPMAPTVPAKSVAVLPFVDMSEKHDQEYFADGMAEEVSDLLSQIPGLTVIGRTSSFQFKGVNQDPRVLGRTLGVAYVLEGSVRRSFDRLRVTAQLIDTRKGTQHWSESYDRPLTDTLQVEDAIAASLVRALEVAVGANRPQLRRTRNAEAYDLYLRGAFARDRHDRDGLTKAATYYQQAMQLDPTFAEAAACLAITVYEQALSNYVSPSDGFSRARLAAQTAIKLDPALGVAHAILGAIYAEHDWDYGASERESKLAVALVPHDAMVLAIASHLPQMLGQDEAARRMLTESVAYDPLYAPAYLMLATVEAHSGHWPEAEAAQRRAMQINPAYGHLQLGEILLLRGDKNAALAEFMREEDHLDRSVGLALVYHALNRKAESDAALRTVTTEGGTDYAYLIAEVHAYRGEVKEALQGLDRLYERKDSDLSYLKEDVFFKVLVADPRYKALLHNMKLPE